MDFATILALAGVGLIVAAVLGGGIEAKEIKIPPLSKSVRIVSALVGIALLGAAYYVNSPGVPGTRPHEAMSATFEHPAPNAQVSLKTELRGTVAPALPDGGKYWLIARDDDGDYYPQAEIAPSPSGTWAHSLVLGPAWSGRSLNTIVVFASQPADEILLGSVGQETLGKLPRNVAVIAELRLTVE